MECVEGALKSSIRKEIYMSQKLCQQQASVDELLSVNMQNGVSCDDFFVDDLLDFSNEEENEEENNQEDEQQQQTQQKSCPFVAVSQKQENPLEDSRLSCDFHALFESLPSSEFSVPADDLASLEWVSHFVEDSNLEYSAPLLDRILPQKPKVEKKPEEKPVFKTPIPAKARSKRTRTGVRVWPLGSPETSSSSSSSSSSTSSTITIASASSSPLLISTSRVFNSEMVEPVKRPPVKKQKKKPALGSELPCPGGGNALPPRRCSHCGVQKTPQWRTGPLGAKTLCNACGVRFKSGRLFPEYRPACSPTFSSELHSNHHRKVLEMRKKKELSDQVEPGLVQSISPTI